MAEIVDPPQEGSGPATARRPDPPMRPEPHFATFYGFRQVGTSAYCTPSVGSHHSKTSPTNGKSVRPFPFKAGHAPGNVVVTTTPDGRGRGDGAATR